MTIKNFIITPLIDNDANQLHQFIVDNRERLKYYFPVTISNNETFQKTQKYIKVKTKEIAEKSNFTSAIRYKDNQEIAGLIIIKKIDWNIKQGEFAYCIGSKFEGKKVTSFAVQEMTKFAFQKLNLKTIQIIAHKTNIGSVKVATNNGFVWQRTLVNEFTPTHVSNARNGVANELPLDMELYELYNEK